MQSSGDDGIVIFTLGSMVPNITREKGNIIASALAQIPQKVKKLYPFTNAIQVISMCSNKGCQH